VDRRADIWAFGCVLYEMLTGKQAFQGESVTDTLAAVIKEEPNWSRLPAATPMRVRVLLQRCLQKDPKQRLRDIGDARISLDEVLSGTPEAASSIVVPLPPWRRAMPWAAGVLAAAIAGFVGWSLRPSSDASTGRVVRFQIPFPPGTPASIGAISPDGRKLAIVETGANGHSAVWLRSFDTLEAHEVAGTEGAGATVFWSPDSRFIAFSTPGKLQDAEQRVLLRRIDASGGPSALICGASSIQGGSWNRDGQIVFGAESGVMQVAASGGSPVLVASVRPAIAPFFLPDGHHFIFFSATTPEDAKIYLGSTDARPGKQSFSKLLDGAVGATYAPSAEPGFGYLLYVRDATLARPVGTVMAQRFDERRLQPVGEAIPIAGQVGFSLSGTTDVLAYVAGYQEAHPGGVQGDVVGQLTWFDRSGKALGTFGDSASYRTLALSPDGKRVAFDRSNPDQNSETRNIWLYEFARGVTTRFTFDAGWDTDPVWSPDGSVIAFSSNRGARSVTFDVYTKQANLSGEDQLVYKSPDAKIPSSWSPDGRFLFYFNPIPPFQMWLLPIGASTDRRAVRIDNTDFRESSPRISPDGRWIAYSSNESGRTEIYVRPFGGSSAKDSIAVNRAPVSGKWMVSKDGGVSPRWRRDGKELFYLSSIGGTVMSVAVNTSGVFQADIPKSLFKAPAGVIFWDVSTDGKRFLMPVPQGQSTGAQPQLTVVLNWQAALKK